MPTFHYTTFDTVRLSINTCFPCLFFSWPVLFAFVLCSHSFLLFSRVYYIQMINIRGPHGWTAGSTTTTSNYNWLAAWKNKKIRLPRLRPSVPSPPVCRSPPFQVRDFPRWEIDRLTLWFNPFYRLYTPASSIYPHVVKLFYWSLIFGLDRVEIVSHSLL